MTIAKKKPEVQPITEKTQAVPVAQKITLRDFKSWLSGVEEMQEDDWSPSTEQWRRIRQKIDLISEDLRVNTKAEYLNGPQVVRSTLETAPARPAPLPASVPMATADGQAIKTPNIGGTGYRSPFAE